MKGLGSCLVIDDDTEDQEIFHYAVRDVFPDINCSFALDCKQAISKLKSNEIPIPDFLFVDWNLTTMDATECVRNLRMVVGMEHTSIFILSGSIPQISQLQLNQLNIKNVIKKQNSVTLLSGELMKAMDVQTV